MKNRLIILSVIILLGVLAFVGVSIGIGGGVDAAGDGEFRISGTTLTAYLGSDAYVSIPDTVTAIGEEAFAGNETLVGIIIPNSVDTISYNAFKDCTALTSVVLSDNIVKVGPGAFEGCTSLATVEIGRNVSSWGSGVFTDCTSLSKVILDENNSRLTYYNGALYNGNMTMLYQVLPGREGENYVMPETVTQIDTYAFWNLQNVVNVMLSEKLESIPKYSMTNMGSVENVVILSGTTEILEKAFANNESLAQVYVPKTVKELADTAFSSCPNLKICTTKGSAADEFGAEHEIEVIYSAEYPIDFLDSNEDLEEMPDIDGDTGVWTDEDVTVTETQVQTQEADETKEETAEEPGGSDTGFENAQDYVHPLDAPESDDVVGKTVIVAGKAVVLMNNHDGEVYGEASETEEEPETEESETEAEETQASE